ncbi:CPBP family intramembrane glutamic endopeptidase [Chitinophaga sp. HK235]|uniref:CPBP family intramembrane glutamic endopeptidase n=1 Tax=Chitinophaga sp. HK235 TaxID=2952571 RepID=UPI001BA5FBEF|nr:CPBP family intramembrane glutamic endopeptidase [Chitinophaga sp. HK235]
MKSMMDKFRTFYTAILIVICPLLGQLLTMLLTSLVFTVDAFQMEELTKDIGSVDKSLVLFQSVCYSLFSFLIVPVFFLLLLNKPLLRELWANNKVRPLPLILSILPIVTMLPLVTILINLNHSIELPASFAALEKLLKESEAQAGNMTNALFNLNDTRGFIVSAIVMAVIPGIVEEFFFRGMIQLQLQHDLRNHHYAVWVTAFLFSLFHFQFYSFIPIMISGALLGYIFVWSKNIWYAIAAHITNNLIVILLHYAPIPAAQGPVLASLAFCALIVTVFVTLVFRKVVKRQLNWS